MKSVKNWIAFSPIFDLSHGTVIEALVTRSSIDQASWLVKEAAEKYLALVRKQSRAEWGINWTIEPAPVPDRWVIQGSQQMPF